MADNESFWSKLRTLLVDKVLIGSLAFVAGLIVQDALAARTERQTVAKAQMVDDLQRFFWPVAARLELDSAYTCGRMANLYEARSASLRRRYIQETVIPNQQAISDMIEKHGDLLAADTALHSQALRFMQHASLYIAIAKSDSAVGTPETYGANWPNAFLPVVRDRAGILAARLRQCNASAGSCTRTLDWLLRPGSDSLGKTAGECDAALSIGSTSPTSPATR
jgi:hypothetical protein